VEVFEVTTVWRYRNLIVIIIIIIIVTNIYHGKIDQLNKSRERQRYRQIHTEKEREIVHVLAICVPVFGYKPPPK